MVSNNITCSSPNPGQETLNYKAHVENEERYNPGNFLVENNSPFFKSKSVKTTIERGQKEQWVYTKGRF